MKALCIPPRKHQLLKSLRRSESEFPEGSTPKNFGCKIPNFCPGATDLLHNLALVDDEALQSRDSRPKTVLSLGEHQGAGAVENLITDFLRVSGKAVHELPVLLGTTTLGQIGGNLEALEGLHTLLGFLLLTHGDPGIGDQDISILDSLFGDVGLGELSGCGHTLTRALDEVNHVGGDLVALGSSNVHVNTHLGSTNGQIEENIVSITNPSNLQALQT